MLLNISIVSYGAVIFFILLLLLQYFYRRKTGTPVEKELIKRRNESIGKSNRYIHYYNQLYTIYIKVPIIRGLTHQLMTNFMVIGEKNRQYLIRKSVGILTILLLADTFLILFFWQITKNWLYLCIFVFFLWYIAGSYLDYFVAKGHLRLLIQMISFIGLVRQKFYEFNMIDDAVYEATNALEEEEREMAVHGERIYEVLIASQDEKKREEYNETAPNPFLKIFLNLSYMTMEYGDQKVNDQSVFLTNLSFLTKNIQLEIDKRKRLNYALKSMNVIVIIPLLLMSLIKNWAVTNFPPLGFFYESPAGKYIEILTIFLMLCAMALLNTIQRVDAQPMQPQIIIQWLNKVKIPLNDQHKSKWFFGISIFLLTLALFASIQQTAKWKIKDKVYYQSQFLGAALDEKTIEERKNQSTGDYPFIRQQAKKIDKLKDEELQIEVIRTWIGNDLEGEREQQILEKMLLYNSYYLKFWHILMAIMMGSLGYFTPEINQKISQRMRGMDIDDEVAGFRSIIMMLMHHPRMNVEEMLIWMESYAAYFKDNLHHCILNITAGEYKAIMETHDGIQHGDMRRLLYQLGMASQDIRLEEAFDELIQEKTTFFEERKWQNEQLIQRKMIIGQNIGFLPAYSLIILYMIVPMVIASTNELNGFFNQLS